MFILGDFDFNLFIYQEMTTTEILEISEGKQDPDMGHFYMVIFELDTAAIINRNGSLCINGMRQQTYYELSAAIGVKGKNKQANYSEPVLEFVRKALPGSSRDPKPWPAVDAVVETAYMTESVPSEDAAKAVARLFVQLADGSQAP
jgi:hypothetical protein